MSRSIQKNLSNNAAVRIRIFWREALLDVVELSPPRAFFIGDAAASKLPVDLTIPGVGAARVPLVTIDEGEPRVRVPFGASAVRRGQPGSRGPTRTSVQDPTHLWAIRGGAGDSEAGASAGAEMAHAHFYVGAQPRPEAHDAVENDAALDTETTVDVRIGEIVLSVTLGEREERCPRALGGDGDSRPLSFFALSALASGVFMLSMAFFTPPMGLTDDESADRNRIYMMQQYLDAAAEREHEPDPTTGAEKTGGAPNAAPEPGARGEAGKMGKPNVLAQNRRASGTGPGAEPRPATSREEDRALAQNFGVIGILSSGALGPTSAPWDDSGVGSLAIAGGMFGTELGESGGVNGLTLSGIGEGGGEHGEQIGLLSIGTCHGEACTHGIGRTGQGGDRRGPGHTPMGPRLRMAGNTDVSGSIPPEVIQRVVRQSFGRFRACYEDGLRGNPNLEGRVTARFVIARDGSVATVQSGGSDLPDAHVVACVLHAYGSLTFPSPKDGVVRVSYPLMFSPSA